MFEEEEQEFLHPSSQHKEAPLFGGTGHGHWPQVYLPWAHMVLPRVHVKASPYAAGLAPWRAVWVLQMVVGRGGAGASPSFLSEAGRVLCVGLLGPGCPLRGSSAGTVEQPCEAGDRGKG